MATTCQRSVSYSSPPSSRQPPDGHEFPADYLDDAKHRGVGGVWRNGSSATTLRDEKSERSVRDKIALFTSDAQPATPVKSPKYPALSSSVDNLAPSVVRTLPRQRDANVKAINNERDSANLSERSRSLLDVASPLSINIGNTSPLGQPRRSPLANLVTTTRKLSNSKLRGLIIPDAAKEPSRAVIDLPEIISKESVSVVGLPLPPLRSPTANSHDALDGSAPKRTTSLSSLPWKSNSPGLPKYSPAFKRKELTVAHSYSPPLPACKPPALPTTDHESDGDSAVSSSQSFSPSGSPVPGDESNNSARVLKAQSVEALNRKNVLHSARYSSGGDVATPATPPVGKKKSGEFVQTLRKFTTAEAGSRIERSSPRLRLSSSERLEIKTALVTDVCDRASPPVAVSSPRRLSAPAGPKEIKSFRALAERWEAISSEPTPCTTPPKSPECEKAAPVVTARTVTTRSVSAGVVEIRKAFERVKEELETESNSAPYGGDDKPHSIFSVSSTSSHHYHHQRMSSLDSTTSEESSLSFYGCASGGGGGGGGGFFGGYGSPFGVRDTYGSITSLASSTSLISPQELQQLLEDANQSLEESGTPSHEIVVVVLHRGDMASSLTPGLGITLAGGADYETKEITIHKVIVGSVADRDGRIQKGDRVLSINGKGLKGVTHREALAILKAPRPEVVLVLSRNRSVSPQDICHDSEKDMLPMIPASTTGLCNPRSHHYLLAGNINSRPPRILESPSDFNNCYDTTSTEDDDVTRGPAIKTTLVKDGAGLGFSLEGGKDSPLGDRPLTIKKIFTGGAASKNGTLRVGDQIISVNGCDVTAMSRIEAWNLMKKLPDGAVSLVVRQHISLS